MLLLLTLLAEKRQGDGTGAGVGTDDTAYQCGGDIDAEPGGIVGNELFQRSPGLAGVPQQHGLAFVHPQGIHSGEETGGTLLGAPGFACHFHPAVFDADNGLNRQQTSRPFSDIPGYPAEHRPGFCPAWQ